MALRLLERMSETLFPQGVISGHDSDGLGGRSCRGVSCCDPLSQKGSLRTMRHREPMRTVPISQLDRQTCITGRHTSWNRKYEAGRLSATPTSSCPHPAAAPAVRIR